MKDLWDEQSVEVKKKKPRSFGLLHVLMLIFSLYFLFQIGQDLYTGLSAAGQLTQAEEKEEELAKEKENLMQKMENWTNPDYLDLQIRSRFHQSREGEKIFLFPDEKGGS